MQKLIKFLKKNSIILLLILLLTPSFARMIKPGIYSMQDFHFFRLFEFNKCVENLELPCRWAPDAGLGYGEPLFNFYGQMPYLIGEIFYKFGFNFINSLKILFIISIVGSGVAMFILSRKIWNDTYAAIVSSILYVYAPYRAVDVWVRGALPEAFSFLIFPLIILSIESNSVFWFSVTLAFLVLTHNLSVVLFLPFVVAWIVYRKFWKSIYGVIVSLGISAFYVLPVIFESKFVNIESTIRGYFDYRAHFVTLYQLLISNFWGYGGSTWGASDGLSLSIGYLQWILPLIILGVFVVRKKISKNMNFFVLISISTFYLFLTHNKSTFIWEMLPFMAYIQFPWRFLGVCLFGLSLSSGAFILLTNKRKIAITAFIIFVAVFLTFNFFKEDIWYNISDNYFLTGQEWNRQRSASIGDFWPNFGHLIPTSPSDGTYINYFPGWLPDNHTNGLIPRSGSVFKDTPVRSLGNYISLISILLMFGWYVKTKWKKEV